MTVFWVILSVWSIFWKGTALWHSSSQKQKTWFIAILVINLLGLLEIAYLFKFAKKRYTLSTFITAVKTFSIKN